MLATDVPDVLYMVGIVHLQSASAMMAPAGTTRFVGIGSRARIQNPR